MNPTITYCHGISEANDPARFKARSALLLRISGQAQGGTVAAFRDGTDHNSLHAAFKNVPTTGNNGNTLGPVVLFVHWTPLAHSISEILSDASGCLSRVFIIFISGEALAPSAVAVAIEQAKGKKFGGCAYWPLAFDTSENELEDLWKRLGQLFSNGAVGFDDFHEAVLKAELRMSDVAESIHGQLFSQVVSMMAQGDPAATAFLTRFSPSRKELQAVVDFGPTEADKRMIRERICLLADFERLRSRVRHHELGNRLLLRLNRLVREYREGTIPSDEAADLADVARQDKDTYAEFVSQWKRLAELDSEPQKNGSVCSGILSGLWSRVAPAGNAKDFTHAVNELYTLIGQPGAQNLRNARVLCEKLTVMLKAGS